MRRQQSLTALTGRTVPRLAPGARRRRTLLVACVLALAAGVAWAFTGPRAPKTQAGSLETRLASDCDGTITDWLLGLPDADKVMFEDAQVRLVTAADPAIRFHVYYAMDERRASFEAALRRRGNRGSERVRYHKTSASVWPWMRDLFLAANTPEGAPAMLLHHPGHYGRWKGQWSAEDLKLVARTLDGGRFVQTGTRIDGGSIVVDAERVLASQSFVENALEEGDTKTAVNAVQQARKAWGWMPVELLPVHEAHVSRHCDLVMMPAGERRVVIASPALGAKLLRNVGTEERARFVAAFQALADRAPRDHGLVWKRDVDVLAAMAVRNRRKDVQRGYDRLRRRLEALGYTCIEMPQLGLVPKESGIGTTFCYVNAVIDERDGRRTVYMPTFNLPTIDGYAAGVWRRLGYRVVEIDCLAPALSGGAVHCMSQVFRKPAPRAAP